MGLLDQVIGGVLGNVLGGGRSSDHPQGGGGLGGSLSPIVQALLMLLLQKGGGLGDILGGGSGGPSDRDRGGFDDERGGPPEPYGEDEEDRGGFNQGRGPRDSGGNSRDSSPEGDFSDLSGMLDGPGNRQTTSPGAGPYGRLDHEQGEDLGGLDGLIDRFQRGGLGDAMNSWIGHGQNQPVKPQRLADALGSDTVNTLQSRTGLSRDDLLSQLAQALPGVIDGLTPQGRRPEPEERRNW
ncbi:YidB family protein [Methylobacterium marchantiae]|uniref:YidB family protein n=1 Tax=Methylobacterium marchantiae TaxID=600331 RepID=A0ABW3X178_9HYPH|nr:hypothetical protein AIGOOFII_1006 [Methylobacterium marchantiae]